MGNNDLGLVLLGLAGLGLVWVLGTRGGNGGGLPGGNLFTFTTYAPKHYIFESEPVIIKRPKQLGMTTTNQGRRTTKQYVDIINAAGRHTAAKAGSAKFRAALSTGQITSAISQGGGSPIVYNTPQAASGQPLVVPSQRALVR